MLKEFNLVFCIVSLYLVKDIVSIPFRQNNGQPISQWSGQINGFDTSHANYIPSNGMSNGNSNGSNGNVGNSSGGNGSEANGMNNGPNNGGSNNGIPTNGWTSGWNNGSGLNGMRPSNVMGDDWSNGFSGMSWSNGTNSTYAPIQNQIGQYPGGGYPSMYYQQYSQSFVMPTPASVQDLQNATPPSSNNFPDQMYNQGVNMGNINNPSGFQFQCMPTQSSSSTMSPGVESPSTTTSSVTPEGTIQISDGNEVASPTVASTRKRSSKH